MRLDLGLVIKVKEREALKYFIYDDEKEKYLCENLIFNSNRLLVKN